MKRKIKFFTSVFISAVMVVLMTAPAFAEESSSAMEDTVIVSENTADTEQTEAVTDNAEKGPENTEQIETSVDEGTQEAGSTEPSDVINNEASTESDSEVGTADESPSEELTVEATGSIDSDALLYDYIEEQLGVSTDYIMMANSAADNLNIVMSALYDYYAAFIRSIANGTVTSTLKSVTADELGLTDLRFSAADLGVSSVVDENGNVTDEAAAAFAEYTAFSYRDLYYALNFDMPSEIYWMGLVFLFGSSAALPYVLYYENGEYSLGIGSKTFAMCFTVNDDYVDPDAEPFVNGSNTYNITVDSSKIASVNTALDNAKAIVSEAASLNLSDLETLNYYFEKLRSLSDYNSSAAASDTYGDPFQIVYMFDGDPTTKVVCEGYAKSFQYLCGMTDFDSPDIYCISVTGVFTYNNSIYSGGNHMWNIVHMDDDRNYLVDITNSTPSNPKLYMKSYTGIAVLSDTYIEYWTNKGLSFSNDRLTSYGFANNYYYYTYTAETVNAFSELDLQISAYAYGEKDPDDVVYCTVTFEPNNGEEAFTGEIEQDTAIEDLPDVEYDNAVFEGWYDEAGNKITTETICSEDTTYYARWTPSKPAITSLSYVPSSGVTVTWDEVPAASSYVIERRQKGGSWQTIATVSAENGTTYLDAGPTEGYIYAYRLYAISAYGDCTYTGATSYYKNCAVFSFNGSVALSNTENGIQLSWDSTGDGIKYNVYRGTSADELTLIGSTSDTAYEDTDVVTGTGYYYRVAPYDTANNKNHEGYPSSISMFYRVESVAAPVLTNEANGIKVAWDKINGADGYIIYRSKSGGSYSEVQTVTADTTSWTDTSALVDGSSYRYRLKAYVNTPDGPEYSTVLSAALIRRLSQPAIISIENSLTTGLTVNWTKTPYADGYYIYRTKAGGSYKLVNTITSAKTVSWNDTVPTTSGAKYYYKIVAFKTASGITYYSAPSESFTYKLKKPALTSVTATSSGWKLSWNAINGATGYVIYRSINGGEYTKVKTITSGNRVTWTNTKKGNKGDTYSYKIQAVMKVDGISYLSTISSAKSAKR